MKPAGRLLFAASTILLLLIPFLIHFIFNGEDIAGAPAENVVVSGDSDVYDCVWHFWWVGKALGMGVDPRFCPLTFYPEGATVAFQNIGWPDTWLMALTGLSENSPVSAYNLSILFGTILAACGAFWAAKQWGLNTVGCLFAALALAWLPSRIAHMGQHYQIASLGYLAFSLGAIRAWLTGGKAWQLILVVIFSLLACLESAYFAILGGFGLLASILLSFSEMDHRAYRICMVVFAFLATVLAAGAYFMTSPGLGGHTPSLSWREAVYWAAEPQSWLLPSPYGVLGRTLSIPAKFSWMSNSFEGVVTPGLTLLGIFVFSVVKRRKWLLAGLIGFLVLLSLGPELRIFGRPLGIPLPYRLILLAPLLDGARSPSRFALLAGFFIALEAGRYFSAVRLKWKFVLGSCLILELMLPSLTVLSGFIPEEYERMTESDGPVLEVPSSPHVRRYIFFQVSDGLPRLLSFMVRPGSSVIPENLAPFRLETSGIPDRQDALATGAKLIVYNRWMFSDREREIFDSRFSPLFEGFDTDDSLWIWRSEE